MYYKHYSCALLNIKPNSKELLRGRVCSIVVLPNVYKGIPTIPGESLGELRQGLRNDPGG